MNLRKWTAGLASLSLVFICGCGEVDTDLTINADGSGKMVQKVDISPLGYMFLEQARGSGRGLSYRAILTEDAAKEWSETHADGAVKVISFSAQVGEDRSFKGRCEITFSTLEEFAASPWGWPLQLGVTQTEKGVELQFSDAARIVSRVTMGGEFTRLAEPPSNESQRSQYWAMLYAARRLSEGGRCRMLVNLPAAAIEAQGASLSTDKKSVVYEVALGGNKVSFDDWMRMKQVAVALPAIATLKPFPVPQQANYDMKKPTPGAPTAGSEIDATEGLQFRPTHASLNKGRNLDYRSGKIQDRDEINLTLALYGPEKFKLLRVHNYGPNGPDNSVTVAEDAAGNDLRRTDGSSNPQFSMNYYGPSPEVQRERPIGQVNIRLKTSAADAKTLRRLEGYVTVRQVIAEKTHTLKPLRNELDKFFDIGNGMTLCFTAMEDKSIKYRLVGDRSGGMGRRETMSVKWYAPDGKEIRSRGTSGGSDENGMTYDVSFQEPFPADGYVIITYASNVQDRKLPFSLTDVKLP